MASRLPESLQEGRVDFSELSSESGDGFPGSDSIGRQWLMLDPGRFVSVDRDEQHGNQCCSFGDVRWKRWR